MIELVIGIECRLGDFVNLSGVHLECDHGHTSPHEQKYCGECGGLLHPRGSIEPLPRFQKHYEQWRNLADRHPAEGVGVWELGNGRVLFGRRITYLPTAAKYRPIGLPGLRDYFAEVENLAGVHEVKGVARLHMFQPQRLSARLPAQPPQVVPEPAQPHGDVANGLDHPSVDDVE